MCGIIGYLGNNNTKDVLIDGLKKLEYRGYDSAGIAVLPNDNVIIYKAKGKIKNLEETIKNETISTGLSELGSIGIGHTRWATHGEPNKTNCHPHYSNDKTVTVVHNGIIENYLELKKSLTSKGYEFYSETDTETVPNLFHSHYNGDMLETLYKVTKEITGSYALCVMCQDHKDKIVVTRKDSPLIIGLGEGENFIASDIPAILDKTKKYYLLDDNEMAVITKDNVTIYNEDKKEITKEIFEVDWDITAAEKDGYEHFMMKEMMEQPKCISKCIGTYIQLDSPVLEEINFDHFNMSQEEIKNIGVIHIVACGSAYNAGMVGKSFIEKLCRIPVNLEIASEFRYKDPILRPNDVCIIISQSGETADTLAALREAKSKGVNTISIVNVVGSSIARESDNVIYTLAGPEIAVATTKGYSTQMTVLYMLGLKFACVKGNISKEKLDDCIHEMQNIPEKLEKILSNHDIYKEIALKYHNVSQAFMIGRGLDYAVSLEAVLKLKEISYIYTEAYPAGELKHGSIALIEDDTLVLGIITQDELYEKTISNLKEVKARGAKVIIVAKECYTQLNEFADEIIYIPNIIDEFIPLVATIPMQLLAYYIAKNRDCDIDMPKNLAKSVTVE